MFTAGRRPPSSDPMPPPFPPVPSPPSAGRAFPALAALLLFWLAGCGDGNLFRTSPTVTGPDPGEDGFIESDVRRYFEEATGLGSDDARLHTVWIEEVRVEFRSGVPARERDAFERGILRIAALGGPAMRVVPSGGNVVIEAVPPFAFRQRVPDRPSVFGRTLVSLSEERGLHGADVLLSLELGDATLERVALHALGHVVGLVGHPSFPGDRFVMAAESVGPQPPTRYHSVEEIAIALLYSPGVEIGLTRSQLRALLFDDS